MALETNREAVMSALSTLGFEVFRQGQFHWNSKSTPDCFINKDGTIHCWTGTGISGGKPHGDLIDFIMTEKDKEFIEARELAYRLINEPVPSLESYKDIGGVYSGPKQTGKISEDFIRNFEAERKENFGRFLYLLNEVLPSLSRPEQTIIAQKYNIGYSKMADRLIMPIRDENGNAVTLWKYNKNPQLYFDETKQTMVSPSKVKFTKGRGRYPLGFQELKKFQEDPNGWVIMTGGEKDKLNGEGHGYRTFTLGTEGVSIKPEHLPRFEGLKIIICYDYDDAGRKGAERIKAQLEGVAAEVKIWDWELLSLQQGFELFKGFDLTDWLRIDN